MLKELEIENLAVISHERIQFSPHFNVFTGETGAGKSILINGIHAVLGQRVTRDIVRTGCKKATITALFTELEPMVCEKLDLLEISHEDDALLLTRTIAVDGGSTARINGHTTTVSILREIGEVLINIHGQHDSQVLLSPESHLQILDDFGGDLTLLEAYQGAFHDLQQTAKELNRLVKMECEKTNRRQYLQHFLMDTEPVHLKIGEENALEEELILMQHAEELLSALRHAVSAIDSDNDASAVFLTESARDELAAYTDIQQEFTALCERLNTVRIELKDIAEECHTLCSRVDLDSNRYDLVQKQLQEIHRLCREYSCTDGNDLVRHRAEAETELNQIDGNIEKITELKKEKNILLEQVSDKAKALSKYRAETLERFVQEVTAQLEFLNMPNVILTGRHTTGKLTIHGMDNLEFLISANCGEEPKPLAKIASGGELSRIMLALKCVIADRDGVPTLIFDEIDTGVSGKAAQKIGQKLREVGKFHQVICVTHLSQIAVMADQHLMIEKQVVEDRTETHVSLLNQAGRVREIARIMGGDHPSDLLLQSAQAELIRWQDSERQDDENS